MINDGYFDWALGESLAYASLLNEGVGVRLSGQDCERGTFSHRHSVIHCQETPDYNYQPLEHISENQGHWNVINSSLSEAAVLGFEHGYSLEDPRHLVIWEAQFGDFANGAQVIIDQFISSGEQKWLRMSGLVMLLPHGYEGQGPEHSSGRPERFLQLIDENVDVFPEDINEQAAKINFQVVNCSTPANIFHVLRRQIHRNYRKPLIVFTPKWLLNLHDCRSPISDFDEGTRFQRIIPETESNLKMVEDNEVKRVVLCTGKVYYDITKERNNRYKEKKIDIAVIRVEEIAPFPFDLVKEQISRYPNAEICWVQEEPRNLGYYFYVQPCIKTASGKDARYIGRDPSAAPATGLSSVHKQQLKKFLDDTFNLE